MRTPTRTKRMKGINGSQATLNYFEVVKQKPFTALDRKIIELLTEKDNPRYQAQVAKMLHTSRARVNQHVQKLVRAGLLSPPPKYKSFTTTARGGIVKFYGVDWREVGYPLSKDVKLPIDEGTKPTYPSGVYNSVWHPKGKDCTIRQYIGKNRRMLTIGVHGIEGNTIEEADYNHDQKAEDILLWLFYHHPELREATAPWKVIIVKDGEHHFRPADELAKELHMEYGNIRTEAIKIDKTPPPVALEILKGIAGKSDIAKLEARFDSLDSKLDTIGSVLGRIAGILEKIAGISGKEGGEGSIPIKPMDKDNGGMYR